MRKPPIDGRLHLTGSEIENREGQADLASVRYRRLQTLFDHLYDAVFLSPLDEDGTYGNFVEVNEEACRRLGYTRQELLQLNTHSLNPDFNGERVYAFGRRIRRDRKLHLESIHVARDGTKIPVSVMAKLIEIDGQDYVLSVVRDLREEKARAETEERLGLLMEQSWDEIFIVEEGSLHIIRVNDGALDNLGFQTSEIVDRSFPNLIAEYDRVALSDRLEFLRRGKTGVVALETELHRKNGSSYPVEMRIQMAPGEVPPVFIVNAHDISERRHAEERLYQLANFDIITGLPNRSLMMDRLGQAIEIARRTQKPYALLFVDLDGFKKVNDTFGHDAGDRLLRTIGIRLTALLRGTDTVARIGGDEFTVLLCNLADDRAVGEIATRIVTEVAKPIDLDGRRVSLTTSVGIATFDGDAEDDLDTLLRRADQAMYAAKRSGKNRWYRHESSR